MTDNNTFLAVCLADLITQQQKQLIVFCKISRLSLNLFSCFLCKLPLILSVGRTAYIVRDNAKKFTSVGLSYKGVLLFSKIFYMFDVVYVQHFMRIFGSEHRGNAVTKAKGSSLLRKLKVVAYTVQRRARRLSMLPFV